MVVITDEGEEVSDVGFVVESGNWRLPMTSGKARRGAHHCGGKNYARERLNSIHEDSSLLFRDEGFAATAAKQSISREKSERAQSKAGRFGNGSELVRKCAGGRRTARAINR